MKSNNDNTSDKSQTENRDANPMPHIKGWGIDADPTNDPTFPMRNRTNENTKNHDWLRPSLQTPEVEILHSNERPNLTAVFGTSTPLTGLSGIIRRLAFKYSEAKLGHWLALLFADRVNVAEGIVGDFAKGYVPNIFSEQGIKAQWKHDPQTVVTKVVVGAAVITAVALLIKHRRGISK